MKKKNRSGMGGLKAELSEQAEMILAGTLENKKSGWS
jgi:hypothetical protein